MTEDELKIVDAEVKLLVDEGYQEAKRILTDHKNELVTLAEGLLEYETMSGQELKDLLDGKPPHRGDDGTGDTPPRSSAVPKAGSLNKGGDAAGGGLEPQPQG